MTKKTTNIQILIATHKQYKMPQNKIYVPIQVGAAGKQDLGYLKDSDGENISKKNANYCELTAMYWAWKNLKCDVIGLNHYRRYFTLKNKQEIKEADNIFDCILTKEEIEKILKSYDLIVSEKKNLYTKTIYTNYKQQHYIKDLDITRDVIKEKYPKYLESFDKTMKKHAMCICNMIIMQKNLFDEYCEWLFTILFEVEKRTNIENYSTLQKRIYGFISERLLNVWLEYHQELKVKNIKIVSLEKDSYKILVKKSVKRILHIKS